MRFLLIPFQFVLILLLANSIPSRAYGFERNGAARDVYTYVNYAYKDELRDYSGYPMYQLVIGDRSSVSMEEGDDADGVISSGHHSRSFLSVCSRTHEYVCFESFFLNFALPIDLQLGKATDWVHSGFRYSTNGETEELVILGKTVAYIVIESTKVGREEERREFLYSPTKGLIGIRSIPDELFGGNLYLLVGECGFASSPECSKK